MDEVVSEPFDARPMRVEPAPIGQKVYELSESLFHLHDGRDRVLFLAKEGEAIAGYIAASHGWNGCSVVVHFAVARPFRRRGLGSAMMNEVVAWTCAIGLGAIRLETQTNNVAACRFYQSYGFELGGYDRYLYRELGMETSKEVALFWYLSVRSRS